MVLFSILSWNFFTVIDGDGMNDLDTWYWTQGYNGHLTTLERCGIVGVIIYLIIEVIQWINYIQSSIS